MRRRRPLGLLGRLLGILFLVVLLDFMLNAVVFERANEFLLQEEDASRISDQLVVAYRVLQQTPPELRTQVTEELQTERFTVWWSRETDRHAESLELGRLREQIIEREPDLSATNLRLHLESLGTTRGDVGGSMIMDDGSVISFTADVNEAWRFNAQRLLVLVSPTILLIMVGSVLVRATLRPLRELHIAIRRMHGHEPDPIPPAGTGEVRELIEAFNAMQSRIHQLIRNRQLTVSAIAHDLRTPLTRLQMRLENGVGEEGNREAMAADVVEMRLLLQSLQTFNEGLDHREPPERMDLAAMAETLIDDAQDRGWDARYEGPAHLEITGRPLSLRRVLSNLIENALHYAGNAILKIADEDGSAVITVEDDGPGIAEGRLTDALQPFVRLDEARSRDTPGMGLGLAIVDQIVRAEGGAFTLANRSCGGLVARITLPTGAISAPPTAPSQAQQ